MNKDELAHELAIRENLGKREARYIVDSLFEIMAEELVKNGEVGIVGFGRFDVRTRKARRGRNPNTGVDIKLPETKRLAFTASKGINNAIRGK